LQPNHREQTVIAHIIEWLADWISHVILVMGYAGVALLMAIESACIPLPSELIMPFAGAVTVAELAQKYGSSPLDLWGVAFAGAIGCNLGSIVAYWVGARLGRPFLDQTRWVRFFVTPHELQIVDRWFDTRGSLVVFVARLLPVVRTFIALPAGIARMNQVRFHVYTFVGSLPWCWGLAWAGAKLGENREAMRPWFHRFDFLIGGLIVAGAVWVVRSRWKAVKAVDPAA
jgi:membrane protein DedA with SNARE-associated domain